MREMEEDEILIWWGPIPATKIENENQRIKREECSEVKEKQLL